MACLASAAPTDLVTAGCVTHVSGAAEPVLEALPLGCKQPGRSLQAQCSNHHHPFFVVTGAQYP